MPAHPFMRIWLSGGSPTLAVDWGEVAIGELDGLGLALRFESAMVAGLAGDAD